VLLQLVLDAGRIVEFDAPHNLLKNPKGVFRSLVDESGDKDDLYETAAKAARGDRS
jgi:ABC-type proline/glycine betaine transport system ATPase subunit